MKKKNILFEFIKGESAALLFTAVSLAVCAIVIKNIETGSKLISGIMLGIKAVSIATGTFVFCFGVRKKGAVCGVCTAVVYSAVCTAVSVLTASAQLSVSAVADLLFSAVFGAVFGIISVNILN